MEAGGPRADGRALDLEGSLVQRPLAFERDMEQLLRLYADLFGREIDERRWRWKFLPPWVKQPVAWVLESEGRIVAHLGAVPLRGQVDGEDVTFFQFCDIMVDPALRSLDLYGALDPDRFVSDLAATHPGGVVYGFSGEAVGFWYHWFTGRSGAVHVEAASDRLFRPVPEAFRGAAGIELVPWPWSAPEIEALWEKQRGWIGQGLIRDRAYLEWRYAAHPTYEYALLGVLHRGEAVGWIVTAADDGPFGPGREVRIQDLLLPPPLCVPVLREAAGILGADPVVAWLPANAVPAGVESRITGWQVMHHPLSPALRPARLARGVFYTLGEADQWWW